VVVVFVVVVFVVNRSGVGGSDTIGVYPRLRFGEISLSSKGPLVVTNCVVIHFDRVLSWEEWYLSVKGMSQ
jgi:hypothetical protein